MSKAKEDVIVFTDANSMFKSNAVSNLVRYFDSPRIGAVCGRLKLINGGQTTGEGFYWKYETAIKKMENALDCVIGANGAIYAVLRKLLAPLPLTTINDDFTNSMRVIEQGYGVRYADDAVAYEEVNHDDEVEFKRHVRDGAGHYRAIVHLYKLLNPFKIEVFFLYLSHRVIRWLVPFFMILLLVLPLFIEWNPLLHSIYIAEIAFYLIVLLAWLTKTKKSYLYLPFYFAYINIALFIGFLRIIFRKQQVAWTSTKR
jgi:cellulose synthase/poly-beta-1,6-N-acetylglucosamine synthase-like glycosyltransferase